MVKTLNDLLTMSSVKGDLEDIQGFLRGICVRKGIVEASIALKCVLHGLKTSFLWDFSYTRLIFAIKLESRVSKILPGL